MSINTATHEPTQLEGPIQLERPTQFEKSDKSVAELTGDLARQMTALVHHEIDLAKVELAEKGKKAGLGGGMFGVAGLLGLATFACLTVAFVGALHLVFSVWAAGLIAAGGYGLVAGALALTGRRELSQATPPVPEEAIASTKEDVAWLTKQAKSANR